MKQQSSIEAKKQVLAEELWLEYYNRCLFECGLITEAERNRMTNYIHTRRSQKAMS